MQTVQAVMDQTDDGDRRFNVTSAHTVLRLIVQSKLLKLVCPVYRLNRPNNLNGAGLRSALETSQSL